MATAKDIIVKVIPSKIANDFVKKHHYSGKVVNNSQLHFSKIDEMNAGMYKGEKITRAERHVDK